MKLREIAHSRTGDKGNIINLSVIPYKTEDYVFLFERLTKEKVADHFKTSAAHVTRYELPKIHAFNFVIVNALGGGVTRSLRVDKHGKSLSSFLLDMEII